MEGKLPILFLFVILNNACSSPSVLPRSAWKQNINRQNDDEPYVSQLNNENYDENNNADNSGLFERALVVGDTFTPSELLPVTKKLIDKIDYPGQGKGIVSGAKSPVDLADKLFEAFFLSRKRIVKLNEQDIIGLDALQALALSGKVTSLRDRDNIPVTEASNQFTESFRGQTISTNLEPKKSKYGLLTKKDDKFSSILRRRGIKLADKLWKNRHLIVNPERRLHATYKFSKKGEIISAKEVKPQTRGGTKKQTPLTPGNNKTYCHWKYECIDPIELDTCQLKTECNKNTTVVEFGGVPHLPDENSQSMQQFRRMMGITLVDEEVEKILEKRYLKLRPANGLPGPDIARLESLTEYFNNIIMNDFMKSTQPENGMPIPVTEAIRDLSMEERRKPSPGPIESEHRRKLYATPTRSLKPSKHPL